MSANLELRENRERAERKKAELGEAQLQLQQLEGADKVDEKLRLGEDAIERAKRERDKMEGSLLIVAANAKRIKTQLNDPRYKHIDAKHRKKLIEYKTVQMCAADLERYYQALDRALMKFHSSKMEDINKQIKELWNKTYKVGYPFGKSDCTDVMP
ncbi:MAG: hypothetical protein SGPRY_010153 [Prymnesium sp.]